ncbi:hypothetical protein ABFX02_11G086900 [Erythranthe guttata]
MAQVASRNMSLIEEAKEELEKLEFQYPNKFHSLKTELKSFISDLESQYHNFVFIKAPCTSSISLFAPDTQESSSRKKRKKVDRDGSIIKRRRCNTEDVLERAQQCLNKIHHFKTSFYI